MRALKASGNDRGFSLIELLVVMTLFGVLVALGVMPLRNYERAQDHSGSTRTVVGALRNAQVRAVSEGTPYKVVFETSKVRVFRGVPSGSSFAYPAPALREYPLSSNIRLMGASFTTSSASGSVVGPDAYFYARGTASKGSLVVQRDGSTKTYTIDVEGLTARVSIV